MPESKPKRVISVSPMPPEKSAYALARYSRSPDSIRDSLQWVRTHDSQKFLESFYEERPNASLAVNDASARPDLSPTERNNVDCVLHSMSFHKHPLDI